MDTGNIWRATCLPHPAGASGGEVAGLSTYNPERTPYAAMSHH